MYTSVQFHTTSKCTKLSSYQMRQKPLHAKDLVLITKLSDTWLKFCYNEFIFNRNSVLDLGLISIGSLGPRASTKVESHVNFTEPQKVSQPNFFCNIKHREVS